jgi:putative ABC transport system substrate-binding protein
MGARQRRKLLLALAGTALAAPLAPFAQQQPARVARIGVLGVTTAAGYARQVEALRQGFRDLGYAEGKNLVLEFRWADGRYDRLAGLADELIRLKPDVIVTSGAGTRVLKEATTTIPIVMAVSSDAVAARLIASLARPGGNITGSTSFGPEILAKRLELLKEAVPRLARVAALLNPDNTGTSVDLETAKKTAAALKVELVEVPARLPREFEDAFALMRRQRPDGVVLFNDSMFVANSRRLGELSAASRLPGAGSDEYAEGGGLLAYGASFPALWRRAPYFVDRILKGANPATIPVEQAAKFELIYNVSAAKAMGLPVQQSLVLRADAVIQ